MSHRGSASARLSICFQRKRGQKLFAHAFTRLDFVATNHYVGWPTPPQLARCPDDGAPLQTDRADANALIQSIALCDGPFGLPVPGVACLRKDGGPEVLEALLHGYSPPLADRRRPWRVLSIPHPSATLSI